MNLYIRKHLYMLDENRNPVAVDDVLKWAEWFETFDRHVKDETIAGYRISTVFLGIDQDMRSPQPILFETMMFAKRKDRYGLDLYRRRCSTWSQAEALHERTKQMLLGLIGAEVSGLHIDQHGNMFVPKNNQMINRMKYRK